MPTFTMTKNWDDGTVLTEAMLDDIKTSTETFLNTTKIDTDNIATGGVATANLANASVTETKIATSVAGDGLAGGGGSALSVNVDGVGIELSADALRLKDLGVVTAKINDLAVTTGKIAALAVTDAKLAADSVTTVKILDSNVTTSKINDAAVTAAKLAAAVAGDGLSGGAGTALAVNVDGSTIETSSDALRVKDAGITAAKLASDAVTTVKILNANVTTAKIANLAVTDAQLAADSVITSKILNANVTTAKIADGAVTQAKRASLGQSVSNSSANHAATTSWAQVSNLSLSVTTTGRPVFIGLQPDGTQTDALANMASLDLTDTGGVTTSNVVGYVGFYKDDGLGGGPQLIAGWQQMIFADRNSSPTLKMSIPLSHWFIDQPSAGTYTYSVAVRMSSGDDVAFRYTKMVVYEL